MGSTIDPELNGVPADDNTLGDNANGADEDGVQFLASLFSLGEPSASSIAVTVHGVGSVNAWIDFNADGDWDDESEQIVQDLSLSSGTTIVPFEVSANLPVGQIAARVRISSESGLSPTGLAADGEVEDDVVPVLPAGERIELTPLGDSPILIDYSGHDVVYAQQGVTIGRYPQSLFNTHWHIGDESDETIQVGSSMEGEMLLLLGDAGGGFDRVAVSANNQHSDFVTRPPNGLQNIEAIDLRGFGTNRLRIDPVSSSAVTSEGSPLKIFYESLDQVLLEGDWQVQPREWDEAGAYHVVNSGDVVMHLVNDKPMQNPLNRYDVDRNGFVSPLDALRIINWLAVSEAQALSSPPHDVYLDATGEGTSSPLDALHVINAIALTQFGEAELLDDPAGRLGYLPNSNSADIDSEQDLEVESEWGRLF